jgi:hypothetical protein
MSTLADNAEGKGREGKGREGKGRERKGSDTARDPGDKGMLMDPITSSGCPDQQSKSPRKLPDDSLRGNRAASLPTPLTPQISNRTTANDSRHMPI